MTQPRPLNFRRKPIFWLAAHVFVASLFLYLTTTGGSLGSSDAVVTFDLTRSMVERHSLALSGNLLGLEANRGVDGRYYSQFGIGQSLYNVPFYLAGRTVQRAIRLDIGKSDSLLKAAVGFGSAVAAAGTTATVFLFAWLLTGNRRSSLVAAFACGAGSLLWPYARLGFNAPLAAWLLTAAAACLYEGVRDSRAMWVLTGGLLVGLGCLTRHEFVLVAIPFCAWLATAPDGASGPAVSMGIRRIGTFLPGVAVGVVGSAFYNVVRFGHYATVGYTPSFATDGLWSLLASPSGSVFLYSPSVVVGLVGLFVLPARSRLSWLLAGPAAVLFLFYGLLGDWGGGRSYGPRYLVTVLPLLLVPVASVLIAAPRSWRRAAGVVIVLSAVVQLPGVVIDYGRASQTWARTASTDELQHRRERWYAAPLWINTKSAVAMLLNSSTEADSFVSHVSLTASSDRRDFSQQFNFTFDVWWLHLAAFGVLARPLAWALGIALGLSTIVVAVRTWRLAASPMRPSVTGHSLAREVDRRTP